MTEEPRVLGGRYEVGELIGRGGMAEVHAGHDLRLGRKVAIKILRTDLARDTSFLARFRREAQSAAGLNHPAIVAVYDSGEDINTEAGGATVEVPYIIMEHIEGRTLREILNDEKVLDPDEAARVTASVLGALEYSHERGIVHRDIKPANVMVTRGGAVKVMDFGIARALADTAATMTQTQAVLGTARYLSPEQAQGLDVDTRSDLYSSGCLLYELLTGRTPFVGDAVALAYQHIDTVPKPPSEYQHDLNAAMDAIALHALEKKPEARYQTGGEFRADLQAARAGDPISPAAQESLQRAIGAGAAAAGLGAATELIPATSAAASGPPPEQVAWGRDPDPPHDEDDFEDTDEMPVREERHRGGWWVVGALGVLALVAVLWIVFATMGGGGGEEEDPEPTESPVSVTVPDVVGEDAETATDLIEDEGLVVEEQAATEEQVAAATDPEPDEVLAQSPEGGQEVEENSTVTIYVYEGPDAVAIPSGLRGLTEQEARDQLTELDLDVAEEAVTVENLATEIAGLDPEADQAEINAIYQVEPGRVVRTDPDAGESATPGVDEVTVYLAGNTIPVPNLVQPRLTQEQAITLLESVHIADVDIQTENDDAVPQGQVLRTAPGSGNSFDRSSDTLTVYISDGPEEEEEEEPEPDPITIPNLRGQSQDNARAALEDLGLNVASEVQEVDDLDVEPGEVVRTDPAAGQEVEEGAGVTLIVARDDVAMPNLANMLLGEATRELQDHDLVLGDPIEFEPAPGEAGRVLRQLDEDGDEIRPNTRVPRGSEVFLVLSQSEDDDGDPGLEPPPDE